MYIYMYIYMYVYIYIYMYMYIYIICLYVCVILYIIPYHTVQNPTPAPDKAQVPTPGSPEHLPAHGAAACHRARGRSLGDV